MNNGKIKDMMLSNILNRLFLENTRVLFDFMQELSDRCTNLAEPITTAWKYEGANGAGGYVGNGSLKEREKILENLCNEVTEEIKKCYSDDGTLLSQNPLSSYLEFYNKVFGREENTRLECEEIMQIAEMLNYFNVLRYLTEPEYKEKRHQGFDTLPYVFEDMCLSIKNMTGAKSCYLVYKKEGEASQLISRSGYVIEGEEYISLDGDPDRFSPLRISSTEFDMLIKSFYNKDNGYTLYNKKIKIELKETIVNGVIEILTTLTDAGEEYDISLFGVIKEHRFLLFDFPFGESKFAEETANNIKEKRHFYIALEMNDDRHESDELRNAAIRVLFLRNRLWEAVKKYYAGILNFRFYCNYIRPVGNADDVKILHLTDLHLHDSDSWAVGLPNYEKLSERLEYVSKGSKIDLIAVTGDIVDASDAAATAQKKYKRVANLLFEIAKILWGNKRENSSTITLPHDWKRRILITTGNHDYAAMNDVRVQTESRKITTGLPAKSSGGTMSKYTYFLEFLSYFLDAPTQNLLNGDLNEVREYDRLRLIVGVFNTCSQANALQNNKVSFDREKLGLVLKRSNWDRSIYRHIALAHHYPDYFINYFDDRYGLWKLEKNKLYDDIRNVYILYISAIYKYLNDQEIFNASEYDMTEFIYKLYIKYKSNESENPLKDFKTEFDELRKKIKSEGEWNLTKNRLYEDMESFYDISEKDFRYPDEFSFGFLSDISDLFKTVYKDNENFNEDWGKINVDNLTVIAGHTHQAEYRTIKVRTIIGHRFYNEDDDSAPIVFEIISVQDSVQDNDEFKLIKHVLCRGQKECEYRCRVCNVTPCTEKSDCEKVNEACPKKELPICGMILPCEKPEWLDDKTHKDRIDKILNKWKA